VNKRTEKRKANIIVDSPKKRSKIDKDGFIEQLQLIEENTYCWPTAQDGLSTAQVKSCKYVKCVRYYHFNDGFSFVVTIIF
jgi:hypothetical protein